MSREEMEEAKFTNVTAIPLNWAPDTGSKRQIPESLKKAEVWEIWNKDDRKVYWICEGYGAKPLDVRDDPLKLEGFFPTPRPLLATTTNGTIVPVPDYTEYQDQADQLDELTGRIAMVTKAVKVAGLYPADEREIARLFNEGTENQLIPVTNWAAFMDKGGLEKSVMLIPTEKIAAVLRELIESRAIVKNDLYEITGIADIIRGSTQANETATAQRIKGQYATMRLSDKQQEVARFVRDILRMMGEIMCEHFSPDTLLLMSDYDQSDDPGPEGMQKVAQAIALLKNDKVRGFRIEIEDESTIAQDAEAEKTARVEFIKAVGVFIKEAVAATQMVPELGPLLGKMLLFAVRGFKVGRDMETSIEDALQQLQQAQKAAAQQPKPPSPDEVKAQAEAQKAQADLQMSTQQSEVDAMKVQADMAIKLKEMEAKEADAQRQHEFAMADLELKARKQDSEDRRMRMEEPRIQAETEKATADAEVSGLQKEKAEFENKQISADMSERLAQIEGGLMEVASTTAQSIQQSHEALITAMKSLGGPKKIIRGPDGRAMGVEPAVAA